jgi:predicted Fe-Mo cluster-binding NifX family protein
MKIAISATGKGLGSNIDIKFERSNFFLIIDTEKNSMLSFENIKKDFPHEIGNTIGKLIVNEEVDTVITSDIGPSAFNELKRYKIKIYQTKGIIETAIQRLKEGKLTELTKPTVPKYSDWMKKK